MSMFKWAFLPHFLKGKWIQIGLSLWKLCATMLCQS